MWHALGRTWNSLIMSWKWYLLYSRFIVRTKILHLYINVTSTLFIYLYTEDGQLSNREFIAVLTKNRMMRGLEKPKDTGFIKLIESSMKCAKQTRPALLDF